MPIGLNFSAKYFGKCSSHELKRNLALFCTPFRVRGEAQTEA
jgi:hypothetical protein